MKQTGRQLWGLFDRRIFSKLESEDAAKIIFFGWLLLLLVVDLLTLRWFPVPWNDEVMFADPAASWVLQGHWASTAWYSRADFAYWTGNSPGYSFLLAPWLWLWGVNAPAVRSLNCVLIAITFICAWFAVRRLNLIPSPKIRLATLMVLSLCYPVSFCVRVGRPEVVGMLIFSVGALFWNSPRRMTSIAGLICCSLLLPFVGLHYVFYVPVLLGVLLWASGKSSLGRIHAIIIGGLLGGLLLVLYHQFVGWEGLLANMADVRARRPAGIWDNLKFLMEQQILHYYLKRPHFVFLILFALLLGISWKRLNRESRQAWMLALTMLLIPGFIVGWGSQFRAPYHWLAVVPAMILFASAVSQSWEGLGIKTKLACCLVYFALAMSGRIAFLGLGVFVGDAAYTSRIEKAAAAWVSPGDIIYGDWQVYYAIKPRAGCIYYEHIVQRLTTQERSDVTTAFIHSQGQYESHDSQWLVDTFGDRWIHEADLADPRAKLSPTIARILDQFNPECFIGTQLSVYRRVRTTGAAGQHQSEGDLH